MVMAHAEALGMRRYVQAHTRQGRLAAVLTKQRGTAEAFDGIADVWFDDMDSMLHAASTPAGSQALNALLEDESRFIDAERSSIMLVDERELIGPAARVGGPW